MQALTSILGVGSPPPPLASSGQSVIKNFFASGYEIGFFGLLFLAGGFLLPPFDAMGYLGVNLFAVGAPMFGLLKGAFSAGITFAVKYLKLYYPNLWPLTFMLSINPWFVYDIIQTWSPAFGQEGYKIPLTYRSLGGGSTTDGGPKGRITPMVVGMIIAGFAYGGYRLMDYLPPEIMGQTGPMLQKVFLITGGVTALTGGGMTALVALPEITSALKGALASPAPAPAPAGGSVEGGSVEGTAPAPAPAATAPQVGGRAASKLPSLEEVAKGILQKGGAAQKEADMRALAPLFLGGLGAIIAGGISLAVLRNKAASPAVAE
jgi:hypothetical protein